MLLPLSSDWLPFEDIEAFRTSSLASSCPYITVGTYAYVCGSSRHHMPLSLDPLENTSIRLNDPRVSIRTNSNSYSSPWDLVPRSLIRLSTTRTNPLINCIVVWVVNILSVTNDPNLSLRTYPNVFSSYVIFVVHDPLLAIELEDTPNFVHYPSNS